MRGFTLIEVLVALIVFSLGALAVVAIMGASKRANHDAFEHTTVALAAHAEAERRRAGTVEP